MELQPIITRIALGTMALSSLNVVLDSNADGHIGFSQNPTEPETNSL